MKSFIDSINLNLFKASFKQIKNIRTQWPEISLHFLPFILMIPPIIEFILSSILYIIVMGFIILALWYKNNMNKLYINDYLEKIEGLRRSRASVEAHNEALTSSIEAVPETVLKYISKDLELDYSDRISIYRHDSHADCFKLLARYSKNKELRKKGRESYPTNKGLISKAWGKGEHHLENLPDPKASSKAYVNALNEKSGLDKSAIKTLSMQSRSYCCHIILSLSEEPIGVLVIESLNSKIPIEVTKVSAYLERNMMKMLIEAIENNLIIGGVENES